MEEQVSRSFNLFFYYYYLYLVIGKEFWDGALYQWDPLMWCFKFILCFRSKPGIIVSYYIISYVFEISCILYGQIVVKLFCMRIFPLPKCHCRYALTNEWRLWKGTAIVGWRPR